MANIRTFKDVLPGAIVTSDQGKKYVVLTDDAGNRGLFGANGTWIRPNDGELTFGKNHRKVDKIQDFDTLPVLDRVSEGIKYIYTGRDACAPLTTVYTAEDPRVTAAKAKMDTLVRQMAEQQAIIDAYGRR